MAVGDVVKSTLGSIGGQSRNPLYEGTPSEVQAAKLEQVRLMRVLAARGRAGWREHQEEALSRAGAFYVDSHGDLLEVMPPGLAVFEQGGPRIAFNETMVVAFFVRDGDVVLLRRPEGKILTLHQWTEQRQKRAAEAERRERADAQAADRLAKFRRRQPLVPLTAGTLTIRKAAEMIFDVQGHLEAGPEGSLLILLPPRLAERNEDDAAVRAEIMEAAAVLRAAAPIVCAVLGSKSGKAICDRLPDVQAGFAGGTVRT